MENNAQNKYKKGTTREKKQICDLDELQHSETPPQASCIYEQEQSTHKQLQLHQNT